MARPPKGAPYPASVGATFDLAIEKAAGECSGVEALLGFCAFLAPERIPLDLIPSDRPDEEERAEALLTLAAVSLIEHAKLDSGEPAVRTHRLVQLAMRRRLDDNGSATTISARVVRRMAEVFPKTAYRDTSVWPLCTVLLPHVIAIRDRVDDASGDANLAGFLEAAGSYLHRRGAYGEAEPFLERAMTAAEGALGREHPEAGHKALSRKHPAVARALGYFPRDRVASHRNSTTMPIPTLRQLNGEEFSREHPDVAIQLNNLAYLYRAAGRLAEAEPLLKEALAITERALGREHPDMAISLNSLARRYRESGRYDATSRHLRTAPRPRRTRATSASRSGARW